VLAAVNFFLAILGGGVGAVVASVRTLRNLRSIDLERYAREGGDLLFALLSELEENIVACGDGQSPSSPTVRSVWDEARRLGVSDEVRLQLTRAYIAGTSLNRVIATLDAEKLRSPGDAIRSRDLAADAERAGRDARAAFVAARDALRRHFDEVSPPRERRG
jgi:hypothetical protein